MVFSSIVFLFYFLPLVLLLYFIAPRKYRNLILFISSLFFYSWGEPRYIWIMIFSTVLDFGSGKYIDYSRRKGSRRGMKLGLLISLIGNLGLLSFFKYGDFIIGNINRLASLNLPLLNIPLPIGISFYTFQTMSYTIDVYRGDTEVQNNIISFGSYVTLFPQLIAGPIVRYQTVAEEIDHREETYDLFSQGIKRFIIGLGKKVLLANNIGLLWESVSRMDANSLPSLTAWLGILAFSFQIYFDFSGYSDMAIGLGKIFGFNFLENFNYPYMSRSVTEFWRRWHISLGTWFKEYVYIPLGGNRGGRLKHLRNILIVWLLTGIWHGASWNFALWGLYFGLILILEKVLILNILNRLPKFIGSVYTLFLVVISWAIFAFDSWSQGLDYIRAMFGLRGAGVYNGETIYILYTNLLLFIILSIASTNLPKRVWESLYKKYKRKEGLIWTGENLLLMTVFFLVISYLVDQSYNPFLYFRF